LKAAPPGFKNFAGNGKDSASDFAMMGASLGFKNGAASNNQSKNADSIEYNAAASSALY
jgi:hypothetical protein